MRLRAGRINALADSLYLAAESDLSALVAHIDAVNPTLMIVDSVQTIASADIDGAAGGVARARSCCLRLKRSGHDRGQDSRRGTAVGLARR